MTGRSLATLPATATTYRIEIDQAAITAPHFPRDTDWWRDYLPLWFSERRWWEKPKTEWNHDAVNVDTTTSAVVIVTGDRRHATAIMRHLRDSVLATRYMTAPEQSIRLIKEGGQ